MTVGRGAGRAGQPVPLSGTESGPESPWEAFLGLVGEWGDRVHQGRGGQGGLVAHQQLSYSQGNGSLLPVSHPLIHSTSIYSALIVYTKYNTCKEQSLPLGAKSPVLESDRETKWHLPAGWVSAVKTVRAPHAPLTSQETGAGHCSCPGRTRIYAVSTWGREQKTLPVFEH